MVLHPVPRAIEDQLLDVVDLNTWTSTRLWHLARTNSSNRELLRTIRRLLERRKGSRSLEARDWIDSQLRNCGVAVDKPVRRSRSAKWSYVAASGCIVLIGIGQAVGEDIWHSAKPVIDLVLLLLSG